MKALVKWNSEMSFQGKAESGVWVPMGSSKTETEPPKAASPMELLLISLGGCTAMDIVWILQKKRITFDDFWIEIEAERTDQHPKVYSSIHMKFIFVGKDLKPEPLEQAAKLSAEKYCLVGAMVGKVAKITHEVEIREK
ncbi:MAG: OsmC family protein [Thermoplasmata archaeon]|nr:OsmC family protein [Thermoplasmata archaeon]